MPSSPATAATANDRECLLLVGTKNGLYFFEADTIRQTWTRSGPYLAPCGVSVATFDSRDGSIWAAANGDEPWVYRSEDRGRSWQAMGGPFDAELVWSVAPGRAEQPNVAYAGVKPAALYRTDDGGDTWQPVTGLNEHASREEWWEGGGGLILHTLLFPPDRPGRIYAGISVAGLFRSDDDGETWSPVNEGVTSFEELFGEQPGGQQYKHHGIHRCLHKAVVHPEQPDTLFQQNHLGVYRSDDAGDSWRSIAEGLPSSFGFPIAVGAGSEPPIFVIPENGENIRTSDCLAVWRSFDGGGSWQESRAGLPAGQHNVLRDAMVADQGTPTGVYLGTTAGTLYASGDGGESWSAIDADLSRIYSVTLA